MRNIVSGIIGILWGGGITLASLLDPPSSIPSSQAYEWGTFAAAITGVVMLAAGIYYLRKGLRERNVDSHPR